MRISIRIIAGACAWVALCAGISVAAQTPDISSSLSQTHEALNELVNVKDSSQLSEQEKARLESSLKQDILKNVVSISQKQLNDAAATLASTSLPESDAWKTLRQELLDVLSAGQSYYKDLAEKIGNATTSSDLKDIAQELGTKKTTEIDPFVQQVYTMQTALSIQDINKLAQDRLGKIEADVSKVYAQKLASDNTLKDQLDKASATIKDATRLNSHALDIILKTYPSPQIASTSQEFIKALTKEISDSQKKATTTATTTDNSLTTLTSSDITDYSTSLSLQAINKIRDAYDIFLSMSSGVKNYLK